MVPAGSTTGPTSTCCARASATAGDRLDDVANQVGQACAARLGAAIRRFTLRAAEERRAAGQLEFHDLLVLSRQLLRDPEQGPIVRARLHQRYTRLLLDEFQDTDPIQIELAVSIAAADPGDAALATTPWNEVAITPGHLFVVGDPKQSIYRFRRADISTFLKAQSRFGREVGELVELTSNFRSTEPLIAWVNHVFDRLMSETPDVDVPVPSQPDYVALDATRQRAADGPRGRRCRTRTAPVRDVCGRHTRSRGRRRRGDRGARHRRRLVGPRG